LARFRATLNFEREYLRGG